MLLGVVLLLLLLLLGVVDIHPRFVSNKGNWIRIFGLSFGVGSR